MQVYTDNKLNNSSVQQNKNVIKANYHNKSYEWI